MNVMYEPARDRLQNAFRLPASTALFLDRLHFTISRSILASGSAIKAVKVMRALQDYPREDGQGCARLMMVSLNLRPASWQIRDSMPSIRSRRA